MNLFDPWDSISIRKVSQHELVQHFDSEIQIMYVLSGEAMVVDNGHSTELRDNDFYIFSKATQYELVYKKGKVFLFTLQYVIAETQADKSFVFSGDSVQPSRSRVQEVSLALRQLLLMYVRKDTPVATDIYACYFSLLQILERYYRQEVTIDPSKQMHHKIEEIKCYIDHNFEHEITLAHLANQLFISEQYLSRLFKDKVGIGVSEYVVKKRLEKVRKRLLMTEDSITDIVFASGFSNINSFNRLFKKYQGMTPSEFRTESKKNLVVTSSPNSIPAEDFTEIQDCLEETVQPERSQELRVSVKQGREFPSPNTMINLGYAGDLLHRRLIREARIMMGYTRFAHGRIWGIISDEIMVQEGARFDFTKVDDILQAVLDLKLKPFLDLGFKGKVIHENNLSIVKQESFQLKSSQLESLLERYRAFMEHIVDVFGYDEVSTWHIELWKPNTLVLKATHQEDLSYLYKDGKRIDISTNQGYFTYFSEVKKVIKKSAPDLLVGGCGLSIDIEEKNLESFLHDWFIQREGPDFISVSIFPIDDVAISLAKGKESALISSNSEYAIAAVSRLKDFLTSLDGSMQLYVTEFNITINSRDIINDTAFKGPYILKNLIPMLEYCAIVGYWQLSDFSVVTTEVSRNEIFGGIGILSKNGVAKPAFFAFDFLNNLGNELLYLGDGIVITKRKNKLILLLYHYCHLNPNYYYSSRTTFNKHNAVEMFENDGKQQFTLHLEDIDYQTKLQMKMRRMGLDNGAFLAEANKLSRQDYFRKEEIEYLKHRCIPVLKKESLAIRESKLEINVALNPHDMVLIELS